MRMRHVARRLDLRPHAKRNQRGRRRLVLLAVFAVVTTLASGGVVAAMPTASATPAMAKVAAAKPDETAKPDRMSAMTTAHTTGKRVEDLSQRTETTKTYANPDGSWTTEDWAEPVQTQDDQGDWHDIDTTLVETPDGIEPKYVPSDLVLSDGSADQPLAQLTNGSKNVSLGWPTDLPKPELDGNTATYKDVKPGQDLVVTASNLGFEYSLVLNQKPDPADGPVVLATPIDTDGAKLTETPAGGAVVTDGKDTVVTSPQPVMYDASKDSQGEPANAVPLDTNITKNAAGDPQLSVAADQAFLDSPTTQYPVTIDPTVVSAYDAGGDAFVETPSPTSGNQNDPQLRVGTYDGGTHKARSYIRFDSQPWSGSHILSAQLVLFNSSTASCSGNDIQASQITSGWSPSTVSWANQPSAGANPSTYYNAFGSSGCPANYARWDVTPIVNSWNSGGPNAGIRIQAVNGTVNASWRVYYSDNAGAPASAPHINVTYNRAPNAPTTPAVSGAASYTNPSTDPSTSASGTYVDSTTPSFTSTLSDSDGDSNNVTFSVQDVSSGSVVATCGSSAGNGGQASCSTSTLTNGRTYRVYAQSTDGYDSSGYSGSQSFTVAAGTPPAPTISCPSYANGSWTDTVPGGTTTCTVSTASSSPAQPGSVTYTLGNGNPTTVAVPASSDPNVAKVNISVPTTQGRHTINAYDTSVAGHQSSSSSPYAFGFGTKATMDTPGGQALTTVTNGVTLGASGPPGQITNLNSSKAYVQWRLAGSGSDAYTGWTDATASSQQLDVKLDPSGAVRVTGTWDASSATRPVGASADLDKRVPALLDVQVCIKYDDGTHCSWDGTHRQVQHVPHAFGDGFPTAAVGDGQVALWTGEFNTSATDATLPAGNTSLSISRSSSTFYGSATSVASGVFGPGWVASLDGPDGGDAGLVITDNTRADGTITAQDGDGNTMTFVPASGQAQRTGAFTTGAWKPVDEDSIEAGLSAKIDTSSGSPVLTIIEPDGTQTDFTSPAVDGTTAASYVPSAVREAGQPGSTTYQYDSGRVTRILAPVPNGVTCPASGALPDGCRALAISYGTTTGSGDVAGQVKTISTVIGGTTTVVVSYNYDSNGRLASVIDPRNNLTTSYQYETFDNTNTRLTQITQPGLAPTSYEYNSSNKLRYVKRTPPGASTSTALATMVYNVPMSGDGLPDLSTPLPSSNTPPAYATWGQTAGPTYAAAVFGADRSGVNPDSTTSSDWPYGQLYYTDARGYTLNTAVYGAGSWQLTDTEYDAAGHPIRQLDAGDIAAIKGGTLSATNAGTKTVYNDVHTSTSGQVTLPAGTVVTDTYGVARNVVLSNGQTALARPHTHVDYDQGAPNSNINPSTKQEYALPTRQTVTAVDPDLTHPTTLDTLSITKTTYDDAVAGDTSAGWNLGLAGSTTQVMASDGTASAADITSRTRYDARGRIISQWQPKSSGNDAGTRLTSYYTADTSGGTTCGSKPAWAGALCQTSYGDSSLPSTTVDSYNDLQQPTQTTQKVVVGSNITTRVANLAYRADGDPTSRTITTAGLAGSQPVPTLTYGYNSTTGLPTSTTASGTGAGDPITISYDSWGRQSTYSAAAGETTTTTYDNAGRVLQVADPKGTTTYAYDGAGNSEHRGLATGETISNPNGRAIAMSAAYDAQGNLITQTLPGGITQRWSYDAAGEPTGLTYSGQVTSGTTTTQDQTWLGWSQANDVLGRVRMDWTPSGAAFTGQSGSAAGFTRQYVYDRAGRLTHVDDRTAASGAGTATPDTPGATSCVQRDYSFDANGNRTSLTRTPSAANGTCQGSNPTGVTTKTSTYDGADRLIGGYVYDALGRATTVPQADTPAAQTGSAPGALTLGYYDTDAVRTISQNGSTTTFSLDSAGRRIAEAFGPSAGSTTRTITDHYTDSSDGPAWTETVSGNSTTVERYNKGLGGGLSIATLANGTVKMPITDLHGDVVSQITLPSSGNAQAIDGWQDSDEYGNSPQSAVGVTPTNADSNGAGYGWVGGSQRAVSSSGLILMGARVYNPSTGAFTSMDPDFGGNSTAYSYPQDPVNSYDLSGHRRTASPPAGSFYLPRKTGTRVLVKMNVLRKVVNYHKVPQWVLARAIAFGQYVGSGKKTGYKNYEYTAWEYDCNNTTGCVRTQNSVQIAFTVDWLDGKKGTGTLATAYCKTTSGHVCPAWLQDSFPYLGPPGPQLYQG